MSVLNGGTIGVAYAGDLVYIEISLLSSFPHLLIEAGFDLSSRRADHGVVARNPAQEIDSNLWAWRLFVLNPAQEIYAHLRECRANLRCKMRPIATLRN